MEVFNILGLIIPFLITLGFILGLMSILRRYETHHQHHIYTFFIVGIVIFFLCFTLRSFDLNLGMAIGLFAIFGIIRYRTEALSSQIISYLFATIGISVINALASGIFEWHELIIINALVLFCIWLAERFFKKVQSNQSVTLPISDDKNQKCSILIPLEEGNMEAEVNKAVHSLQDQFNMNVVQYRVTKIDHFTKNVQIQVVYESR